MSRYLACVKLLFCCTQKIMLHIISLPRGGDELNHGEITFPEKVIARRIKFPLTYSRKNKAVLTLITFARLCSNLF